MRLVLLVIGLLLFASCSSKEERFAEKLKQANVNLENGETAQAIKILEDLKTEYPSNPEIMEGLAFAFVNNNDFYTAAFYFSQLADSSPLRSDYRLFAAKSWADAGDPDSAIKEYETYLLENDSDWNAWKLIGDLYREKKEYGNAVHAYSKSNLIRFDPQLALKTAILANDNGNIRKAEEGFLSLVNNSESTISSKAYAGLLEVKHKRKQWPEVGKLIETINEKFPILIESSALNYILADYKLWFDQQAEQVLKRHQDEALKKRLAARQEERARLMEAARLANDKKKQDGDTAVQPKLETQKEITSTVEPTALFEETSESEPTDTIDPKSIPDEQLLLHDDPIRLAVEEADTLFKTNSEAGIAKYWEMVNAGDESGLAFYKLSKAYYETDQFDQAEMTALEALRRKPTDSLFIASYFNAIQKSKTRSQVFRELQTYRNKLPDNANLVLLQARMYSQPGGDPLAAHGFYDLFLRMAPNHPEAPQALKEAAEL